MIDKNAPASQFRLDIPEPPAKNRTPPDKWTPFDDFRELSGIIALDTETNDPGIAARLGSSWCRVGEGKICGFGIAHESQRFYVGVGHDGGNSDPDKAWNWLRHHAKKPDVTFVYNNCIYDLGWLLREGIDPVTPPIDIQGMAALLDEQRSSYKLDSLLWDFLGRRKAEDKLRAAARDMGITNPYVNMHRMPTWKVEPYGVDDAVDTLELYHHFKPLLAAEDLDRVHELERECYLVGRDMRWRGVRVNMAKVEKVKARFIEMRAEALRFVQDTTGVPIAPNDNVAIAKALLAENPDLTVEYTSKGIPSIRAGALDTMATPISKAVRTARQMEKAIGTFIEGYLEKFVGADSRIHAEFHPLRKSRSDEEGGGIQGAGPGRWSCVAPWTPIVTPFGVRPISNISPGDYVWTHEERWRKVVGKWIKGKEEMLSFTFSTGDVLTCTRKHRFMLSCGEWVTAGELHERFQELGGRSGEQRSCRLCLPEPGVQNDDANCRRFENYCSQCPTCHKCGLNAGGASRAGVSQIFHIEERCQESYEGEVWPATPQLDRGCVGLQGLSDAEGRRSESVLSSRRDGKGSINRYDSLALRGSSHRWESHEQRSGQSGASDEEGAQDNSCSTKTRASDVFIEKIEVAGCYEVHDITVVDDESYLSCGVYSHNSSTPNLQNIPRRDPIIGPAMRECFEPEEGEEWLKADYSSQEPRISTHFAYVARGYKDGRGRWHIPTKDNDPRMPLPGAEEMVARYLANPEMSFHKEVGKAMGVGTSGPLYDSIKINNLALIYGMTGKTFCVNNGYPTKWIKKVDYRWVDCAPGEGIEVAGEEGQKMLDKHAAAVPWGKPLANIFREAAEMRGYTRTLLGRRIRYKKRYADGNLMDIHKALNNSVQGTAADQMKSAQILFRRAGILPLVVVHDDGNFSKPMGDAGERMMKDVAEIMATAMKLEVPSLAEMKVGPNWGAV